MLDRREPILQTARLRLRPLVEEDARPSYAWAIEHNGLVAGRVGFRAPPWIDYTLSERASGKGLAYEAIEVVCAYVFDVLGWPAVLASTTPRNDRDLRMFTRLGFTEAAIGDMVLLALAHPGLPRALRIVDAEGVCDMALVRGLLIEYQAWLGVDLGFQKFGEEVAGLPGAYVRPAGALLLAYEGSAILGMAGLRPRHLDTAELKRLYVREGARGKGVGRALADAVVARAREAGYRQLVLDTLPVMADAQRLYSRIGFRDIAPYYDSPVHGTRFLGLSL